MANFGGGTGTPITGGFIGTGFPRTAVRPTTYLTLGYYARWIGMSESAIYGIVREDDPDMGCDDYYWSESMRFQFVKSIQQAEKRLAKYLGHPLKDQWICDEMHHFYGNENNCEITLNTKMVRTIGKKTEEMVAADVAVGVDVFAEEYVVSVDVDFEDCTELVVFYPGQTSQEIDPSSVIISGGVATVTIPRSHLLKQEFLIDFRADNDRPRYEVYSNFLETVDIYRRFPDAALGVTFIWDRKVCGCSCNVWCSHTATVPGGIVEQTGAATITDPRLGTILVEPATFNTETGEWESALWTELRSPNRVKISYVSGIQDGCADECPLEPDPNIARAIIGLAHSNLPFGVCSCDFAKKGYELDAFAPTADEGPTIMTPFGTTRGQVLAWNLIKVERVGWGGLFA